MNIQSIIIIALAVLVLLVLVILIIDILKKNKKTSNEPPVSILDVDLNGVQPMEDRTFDYGYEKEDTVYMNPIEQKTEVISLDEEEKK